ncbi:hypothetical protein PanWU01x14_300210 [Parasponia andersonii]|uniref:Uncharacterized protein n=1 Tax=Parasponia andersonii TaxID=3476 RepID=A0A2P5AUB4_PARAD|nr:hypothetical protein PanWU01x14_300210 [Parasponia andersonii]
MAGNSDSSVLSIEVGSNHGEKERENRGKWWKKVLELQLAGATLANSWATVTGYAFMAHFLSLSFFLNGLSGALETLCGQGFGANSF